MRKEWMKPRKTEGLSFEKLKELLCQTFPEDVAKEIFADFMAQKVPDSGKEGEA